MAELVSLVENPPAEPRPEDDEFSQAFAQLSVANDAARGGEAPPKPEVEDTPAAGDLSAPQEAQQATSETIEPEATASQDKPAVGAAAPAPAAPQPPKFSDEELARFAAIAQQVARPQAPPPQAQQPQQVSPYNEEEIAVINEYMQEYPEIARAEALSRRKDIFDAVRYVLGEVNKVVSPMYAEQQRVSQRVHVGDLQQLIPDFSLTREQAIEWTMKQPDYLQPAYFHVIQHGSPQQVADFTRRYLESQGASAPASTSAVVSNGHAAAVVKPQPTPAERRAVAALAPVSTKRSGISADGLENLNDFDGAFERWARQADQVAKR